MPQFGGHRRGAGFVGQAGPPVQQGQCLLGAEHVDRDTCPQFRHRLPGHGDQHPGRADGRNERPQQTKVLPVIEHQQATAPVSLQPVPERLACVSAPCREPPSDRAVASATAANPASRLSLVPSVDPRDQPPAARQPRPRVRGRQLGLAHSPGAREHHHRRLLAGPGSVAPAERAGAGNRAAAPGYHPRRPGHSPSSAQTVPGVRLPGTSRRLMNDRRIHCQAPTRIPGSAQPTAVTPRLRTSTYPPQRG